MVKGVGFRSLSFRGSWVQIPPSAPNVNSNFSVWRQRILFSERILNLYSGFIRCIFFAFDSKLEELW